MGTATAKEPIRPAAVQVGKAARILGVHRSTVYSMIHSGRLDARMTSDHRYIVPVRSLEAFIGHPIELKAS